ncbi:MAG TPA: hypothetical protein VK512_14040 [Xanthobacteraceae bacterium]|nr:hypothetical protein [Xanthobacteraceae bacterium]
MSIIVCLVCQMFLGAIVKVAWGALKLVVVIVVLVAMVHSCDRSNAQPRVADPSCRSY